MQEYYNLTLSSFLHKTELTPARPQERCNTLASLVDKVTQTPSHQESPVSTTRNTGTTTSNIDFKDLISSLDGVKLSELTNLSLLELASKSGIDSNPGNFLL